MTGYPRTKMIINRKKRLAGYTWVLLTSLLAGIKGTTMAAMIDIAESDKFDWLASEGAPELYPMEIIVGHFYNPAGGSLYIPNKATLHHGWGKGWSNHIVGADLKPLPNRLSVYFFSYMENKFYSGEFDLPYEKILSLFKTGYYSPRKKEKVTYHKIVAGVAPGGHVSVWLVGIHKTTEVFSGQAKEEPGNWASINRNPDISREEYIRLVIEETLSTEEIQSIKKNGIPIGLWERYRTRYHWQPLLTGMALRDGLIDEIEYYNGEKDYLYYPLDKKTAAQTRAVPSHLYLVWERGERPDRVIKIKFNEAEIFAAFKKLGANNAALKLELKMEKTDTANRLTIWLHNEKDNVQLKKYTIKTFGT